MWILDMWILDICCRIVVVCKYIYEYKAYTLTEVPEPSRWRGAIGFQNPDSSFPIQIPVSGLWILDSRLRILDSAFWILGSSLQSPDSAFGFQIPDMNAPCGASTAAPYFCVLAFCRSCWRFGGCKLWVAVVMLEPRDLLFEGSCFCYWLLFSVILNFVQTKLRI